MRPRGRWRTHARRCQPLRPGIDLCGFARSRRCTCCSRRSVFSRSRDGIFSAKKPTRALEPATLPTENPPPQSQFSRHRMWRTHFVRDRDRPVGQKVKSRAAHTNRGIIPAPLRRQEYHNPVLVAASGSSTQSGSSTLGSTSLYRIARI